MKQRLTKLAMNPSREATPGFIAQCFEGQNALFRRVHAKLPTGKELHARNFAGRSHFSWRFLNRAFSVGDVMKCVSKHGFLFEAMRAPVKAVHFRLMRGKALGELVVLVILVVPACNVGDREHDDDACPCERLRGDSAGFFALALLLASSA